jgi:hypothetical protein
MHSFPVVICVCCLCVLTAAGASPALAQEPAYFVTYNHYLEEAQP